MTASGGQLQIRPKDPTDRFPSLYSSLSPLTASARSGQARPRLHEIQGHFPPPITSATTKQCKRYCGPVMGMGLRVLHGEGAARGRGLDDQTIAEEGQELRLNNALQENSQIKLPRYLVIAFQPSLSTDHSTQFCQGFYTFQVHQVEASLPCEDRPLMKPFVVVHGPRFPQASQSG
jgi:hypothetical protein